MERILAIQIKRIGDLILTAPALRLLRRQRPDAHITLVTTGAAGQLACCLPGINEHLNFRTGKANLSIWATLLAESYDVSLDFNGTDRSVGMSLFAGAKKRATYTKRALGFPRSAIFTHTNGASLKQLHTIDHMIALLETMGIPASDPREVLQLDIPQAIQSSAHKILQQHHLEIETQAFALIHPGTARSEKYWNVSGWSSVIDSLVKQRQLPVVITGGSDAEELAHINAIKVSCQQPTRSQIIDLAGKLTLTQTAHVISQAKLILGVDTAAMHLASAFQKPQIVLYGPTNPYHWRPLHEQARVILAGHEHALSDDQFQTEIREASMDLVSAPQVLNVAAALLDQ